MKLLSKLKLSQKLILIGSLSILAFILLLFVFQYVMHVEEELQKEEYILHDVSEKISDLQQDSIELYLSERNYLQSGGEIEKEAFSESEEHIDQDIKALSRYFKNDSEALVQISKISDAVSQYSQSVTSLVQQYEKLGIYKAAISPHFIAQYAFGDKETEGNKELIQGYIHQSDNKRKEYADLTSALKKKASESFGEKRESVAKSQESLLQMFYTVAISFLLVFVLILFIVIRDVQKSTREIICLLRGFSENTGNLSDRLPSFNGGEMSEIAHWFNLLMDKLQSSISRVGDLSCHLTEVAIIAQKRRDSTASVLEDQASRVHEISALISSMNEQMHHLSDDAQEAAHSTVQAEETSSSGADVVNRLIKSMNTLANNIEHSSDSVVQLDEYSQTIFSVITIIQQIAEQTNLLALNAAIEAARAGESGRGFAVVADEVRNLSKRTTEATADIHHVIDTLQASTKKVVDSMADSRDKATKGVELANQADKSLKFITDSVDTINHLNKKMLDSTLISQNISGDILSTFIPVQQAIDGITESAKKSISDGADLSQTAAIMQNITNSFGVVSSCGISFDEGSSNASSGDDFDDVELF